MVTNTQTKDLKTRWFNAIKKKNYVLHHCSMCGYACGWAFYRDQLYYDNGCDCTGGSQYNECTVEELDFYLNPAHGHIEKITKFCKEVESHY